MSGSVVIIEDDEDIRYLIQGILTGAGLTVHQADTGAAGIESVREHQPDILVVDFGLPDFNGLETIRRIRAFSQAPALMLTGHDDISDRPYASSVSDLMAKPFNPLELRKRVEKLLAVRPAAAGPASGWSDGNP